MQYRVESPSDYNHTNIFRMRHPSFVTPERLARICKWPTSDRRHLSRLLALADAHGRPTDHKDELAFWRDMLTYLSSGRSAYRQVVDALSELSVNGRWRQIHNKCYRSLLTRCPKIRDCLDRDTADFLREVCRIACEADAVEEAADFLWADWLFVGASEVTNSIIEGNDRLVSRFGDWRASPQETSAELTPVLTYSEDQPTVADVAVDGYGLLFAELRAEVQRAEEAMSVAPLHAAKLVIDKLVERLEARNAEQDVVALAVLREVLLRMRTREAPTDAEAAARRNHAMDRLPPVPTVAPTEALAIARDLEDRIGRADKAKQAFELAETAHLLARFDVEKLQTYHDAITRYGEAESALTLRLEELADGLRTPAEQESARPPDHPGPSEEKGDAPVTSAIDDQLKTETSETGVVQNEPGGPTAIDEVPVAAPKEEPSAPDPLPPTPGEADAETNELAIPELPPSDIVGQAEGGAGHPEKQALSTAANLLHRGQLGLFAIACDVGRELGYSLPRSEIAVVVATSGMTEPSGQLRFTDAVNSLLANCELDQLGQGEVCLLFAALCLPAITDPTFISRNALARLKLEHADFSAAMALRRAIEELGRSYSSVEEFLSSGAVDPEDEFRNARAAALQAAGAIKMKTVNYYAATMVAHRIAQDLEQAAEYDPTNIDAFLRRIDKALLIDDDDDEVIRRLDRELRADKAERKPIEARALTSLKNIVREVRDITKRLRRAASVLREQRRSAPQSREATYRKGRDLQAKFKHVASEFWNLSVVWDTQNPIANAGASVAASLLSAHASAFDTGAVKNPFYDALELDQFRLPGADLDPKTPERTWASLRALAEGPETSWLEAFDAAVQRRQHRATYAFLTVAQPLAEFRMLANEREEAIAQARDVLRNQHRRLQDELLTVMNYAPPGETSLDPLYQSLTSIDADQLPREKSPEDAGTERPLLDFPDAFDEIEKIRDRVLEVKGEALKKLEDRLRVQEATATAETTRHLKDLIKDGDLITLSEELSLIERGQDIAILPPASVVVEEFSKFLTEHVVTTLADWQRGRGAAGVRADALIRKWQATKSTADARRTFRDLFGELGFEPKGEAESDSGYASVARVRHFKIRTRVISDREFCSVARFGSEAEGQYRILVAAKDPKPNEIVTAVPEGDTGATLVFVPQWIGKDMRLQIAYEARRLNRTFCLIDDALIAFLCDRDRIIHDLFGCGIPFAAASPYVTTPGSIPVEAFFGRTAELANISSRDGSCIVYGGRQLGKSVLLDHIEQRSRNATDRVAIRLDCQDLTERRELFELIEKKLPISTIGTRLELSAAIEDWLRGSPERSILLMLDETNKFVRADAERNFDVLLEFRSLMERTNRRFKVVLSGQNNVLRLTQTPNTPLAHFGQPICIGPLKGADYKAARDLVAGPLAAVGYKFAEEQLISRILVETQFYPKLVQMFCRALLSHVRTLPTLHSELPPWKINIGHVETTLRNQKLTRDIFDTFKITLDLDKRYELIALIMALDRSDQRKRGEVEKGMTEQELRDKALYWWKDSFTSSNTREEFEGLLEELEGLGILINDRSTHSYQLASPVIANLIGSEDSIYDRLLSFEGLPPVRDVDPSKRRSEDNPLPRRRGLWLSPLAPAQVNRIVRARRQEFAADSQRTFVVYGAPDMRLDRVRAALEPQKYDEHQGISVASLEELTSMASFAQRLASASKPTFFVVPSKVGWDPTWVDAARRSERGHVTVFVGDLGQAWSHIVESPRGIRRFDKVRIETVAPLSMIEIEDQIRRNRLQLTDDARTALMADTGGFLGPIGQWTERYLGAKRDQKAAGIYPRFESLPSAARAILETLVDYVKFDDPLDSDALRDACEGQDPKRVFDWLLRTGLAELAVGTGEQLLLNRVFWSDNVKRLLTKS